MSFGKELLLKFRFLILTATAVYLTAAPVYSIEQTSRSVLLAQNAAPDTTMSAPADTTAQGDLSLIPVQSLGAIPKKGVLPSTAMYHSLELPGWGQIDNGKDKKALLLIAAELFCLGGVIYEQVRLGRPGQTTYEQDAIRTNRNTFVIYWLGAKLVGMVDAYVDAQLHDFNVQDITPKSDREPAKP
jgi:hypothetical protein